MCNRLMTSAAFIVFLLVQAIVASDCLVIENTMMPIQATNITTNAVKQNLVNNVQSVDQTKKIPSQNPFQTSITDQGQSKTEKNTQLQKLIQQLYLAQAQVQLEANEISKAQAVAAKGQKDLEEATNNVKIITSGLHLAQQAVAQAALRAQTAQLQLAAHDQLLFTARQKVDALSAQMVGLQAEVGIESETHLSVNLKELLQKLREPLSDKEKPTPVPTLINVDQPMNENKPPVATEPSKTSQKRYIYEYDYDPVYFLDNNRND